MKRSQGIGLLAVAAAGVLIAISVGHLGAEGDRNRPAIPGQPAAAGSSGVVDESPRLVEALVDRAAQPTVAERDEGVAALDGPPDILERVLMVLVLRGQLTVEGSAHPPIRWSEARFAVRPASTHAVWIDLRLSAEFEESGAFDLRAECRRMPESAHADDESAIQQIGTWSHVAVTVSHPLLKQATVEVPVAPWPEGLVAGPETEREIDVGTIGLGLASGVLGRVVTPSGDPAGGAVVALCLLGAEDEFERSVQTFMLCDADGRFFLHDAPGARGFVFATAPGMAPGCRRIEIGEETVTDLDVLELEEGYRIAGKVQGSESWSAAGHPLHVQVDGFEQPLQTSRDVPCHAFVLAPTRETFCWNGSDGVFRYLCQVEVGSDGSFEVRGLSQRCHRLRVQPPRVGLHPVNGMIVYRRDDVWAVKCAPATDVVLWPTTSLIHVRILPTKRWPLMGAVAWVDESGNAQSTRVQLDGASLEAMPHQSLELQIEGDPTGSVHRLVAPGAGEIATYEIEVPWFHPEEG